MGNNTTQTTELHIGSRVIRVTETPAELQWMAEPEAERQATLDAVDRLRQYREKQTKGKDNKS